MLVWRSSAERQSQEGGREAQPPQSAPAPIDASLAVSALLTLQASAGNAAVSRLVLRTQDAGSGSPSSPSELIESRTSWWGNLDEAALGGDLLDRARHGGNDFVQQVLDLLGSTDRDDASYAFCVAATTADLQRLVSSESGRRLVDRLFDELTAGSVAAEEQHQADRLIQVKSSVMTPEVFAAAVETAKLFPCRFPGLTVLDDAPILAERRPGGRIWVRQPARVLGTDMFRAETATLPVEVFTSGIELSENEVVGVRMYDLGGVLIYRPALILVQLANETDATVLTKIAEVAGIGLTLGSGALLELGVEAGLAARVLLWADRAAFVLGAMASIVKEHRGEIIERYGDCGRRFLRYLDYVQSATAIYGFARVALSMAQLINGLRVSSRELRAATAGDDSATMALLDETDVVVSKTDDIQRARVDAPPNEGGPEPTSSGTSSPSPSAATPTTGRPPPGSEASSGLPPGFEVPDDFTITCEGPVVSVPASKAGEPARVLEIGAGPADTSLGLPPEPGQANLSQADPGLIDLTRGDIRPRAGVVQVDATQTIPPGLTGQDAVVINNPRGYPIDIANVGQAVRPGGRIIVQGRAEVVPGMRGVNPDMTALLRKVQSGNLPPGYRVVEVVTLPEVPSGNPALVPRPSEIMGGPFNRTTGGPVSWPNTRIVIEKGASADTAPHG